MNTAGLSFEKIPEFSVPLRFYLTAPAFGLLAAILLATGGAEAWASRWTPATLAATHLVTLGFMAMVMLGSLFQLVPVIAGVPIPAAWVVAPIAHGLLVLGTLGLTASLLWEESSLLALAAGFLTLALVAFLLPLGIQLARRNEGGESIFTIRLAALSLLATLGFGLYLVLGYFAPSTGIGRHTTWTDVHASWGLAGWVALLVMGVSYQVIPMFHVAPNYPRRLAYTAAACVFLGLILSTLVPSSSTLGTVTLTLPTVALLGYALYTLALLARRKRRRPEPLIRSWQIALGCLCAAALYNWLRVVAPACDLPDDRGAMLVGVLMIAGFGLTVIEGMLQKIVPFLAFLHLQRACLTNPAAILKLPSMTDFVPEGRARRQLALHGLALAMLVAAVIWPHLGPWAAGVLGLDFAWLARSLVAAAQRFRRTATDLANPA